MRGEEAAEKKRRDMLGRLDQTQRTQDWALHLAYPLLSPFELGRIVTHTDGRAYKRQIDEVSFGILAGRLRRNRKTLVNEIGKLVT